MRELSLAEVRALIANWGEAAARAATCGFDVLETRRPRRAQVLAQDLGGAARHVLKDLLGERRARGLEREQQVLEATVRQASDLGNFWFDLVRSTVYILFPLSLVFAVVLSSQGVVQTFSAYPTLTLLSPFKGADAKAVASQLLAVGPAA